MSEMRSRANFIGAPAWFNLNAACCVLTEAFGQNTYLVGSAITTRDYRDVDIRTILDDEEYERLFPGVSARPDLNALWALMCAAVSLYLTQHSGLPIDFQIQQRTRANDEFKGERQAVGFFVREDHD